MSYHLRVKICGITNAEDGRIAALYGADAVGLNFASESPRRIDLESARSLLRDLPPLVDAVGVFANRPMQKVFEDLHKLGRVRTIQWHGHNRELGDTFPYQLIAAFAVKDSNSLVEIQRYLDMTRGIGSPPSAILVDGYSPTMLGGTGSTAPWNLLADFRPGVPVILAGGLNPDNVAEAVRIVQPYAVDVASGVEASVGKKDPDKIRRFIAAARNAAYRLP